MIQELSVKFGIKECCDALDVSRSGYYRWQKPEAGERAQANGALGKRIVEIFHAHHQRYGSPRVTQQLRQEGVRCGENRVARLMRDQALAARRKKAFRPRTTQAGVTAAPNRLKGFKPSGPDQIWASDITYVATREGWLYLAVILDLFSRRVVGWKVGETLEAELVVTALQNALARRQPPRGLIFHSDRGSQYGSEAVKRPLSLLGAHLSMSGRGNCYDNATAEAFFSTLKTEAFPSEQVFVTKVAARRALFEYIEVYYNNLRLHSGLGYQTPRGYETNFQEVVDRGSDSPEVRPAATEDRAMRGRTSSAEAALPTAGRVALRRPAGPCRSKPKAKNPRRFGGQRPLSPPSNP